MDRSTELIVALTSRDLSSELPAIKSRDLWSLIQSAADRDMTPSSLLDDDAWKSTVAPELGDIVAARLGLRGQVAEYADELRLNGIWISSPFEETWPERMRERLGAASPAILYGAGDADLLAQDGIGVVGSRNLSSEGETATQAIASVAVRAGLSIVSGGARGVDRIAMSKALEGGGSAVGALAHPLTRTMSDSVNAAMLEEGRLCLITPFKPDAGFSVGNAMARNKLIYALSRVTVVVASDYGSGGTWTGATEALDREFGTVAVWDGPGEGPGNAALMNRSGVVRLIDPEDLLSVSPMASRQVKLL